METCGPPEVGHDGVMLAPSRSQSLWDQHQVLQAVVNTDAVLVNDAEAGLDIPAMPLPKEILDIDAR